MKIKKASLVNTLLTFIFLTLMQPAIAEDFMAKHRVWISHIPEYQPIRAQALTIGVTNMNNDAALILDTYPEKCGTYTPYIVVSFETDDLGVSTNIAEVPASIQIGDNAPFSSTLIISVAGNAFKIGISHMGDSEDFFEQMQRGKVMRINSSDRGKFRFTFSLMGFTAATSRSRDLCRAIQKAAKEIR